MHSEKSILALTTDQVRVHIIWEREATLEAAVKALHPMELFVLVVLVLLALTLNHNHVIVERHLDVFLLNGRQFRANDLLRISLADVRARRPVELPTVAFQCKAWSGPKTAGRQAIE